MISLKRAIIALTFISYHPLFMDLSDIQLITQNVMKRNLLWMPWISQNYCTRYQSQRSWLHICTFLSWKSFWEMHCTVFPAPWLLTKVVLLDHSCIYFSRPSEVSFQYAQAGIGESNGLVAIQICFCITRHKFTGYRKRISRKLG